MIKKLFVAFILLTTSCVAATNQYVLFRFRPCHCAPSTPVSAVTRFDKNDAVLCEIIANGITYGQTEVNGGYTYGCVSEAEWQRVLESHKQKECK